MFPEGRCGVGVVESEAVPATEFEVDENGKVISVLDLKTSANYAWHAGTDDQKYFVKIKWIKTVARDGAHDELGFFGNQNSVCKPTVTRWRNTVDRLEEKFQVN